MWNNMSPDEIEGYSIGYYHGRAIGNDEGGWAEIETRFSSHSNYQQFRLGFRSGYDRGVTDYVDFDESGLLWKNQFDRSE